MGTGFDTTILPEELGVIPRAVKEIFSGIEERRSSALERNESLPQFEIRAQFLEVHVIAFFDRNQTLIFLSVV